MGHRIFSIAVASVYPHYVAKAEKRGSSRDEVDAAIRWQTGYDQPALERHLDAGTDFATFFAEAPAPHPERLAVTGRICGIRVEAVEDPLMREIRILDLNIDRLSAKRGAPR